MYRHIKYAAKYKWYTYCIVLGFADNGPAIPPPIEDVSITYEKSLEFHMLFYQIFMEIQIEKTKNCVFWAPVWIFCGNLYEKN